MTLKGILWDYCLILLTVFATIGVVGLAYMTADMIRDIRRDWR